MASPLFRSLIFHKRQHFNNLQRLDLLGSGVAPGRFFVFNCQACQNDFWVGPFGTTREVVTRSGMSNSPSESSNDVVEKWMIATDLTDVSARSCGQGRFELGSARNRVGKAKTREAGRLGSRPLAPTRVPGRSLQTQNAPRVGRSSNTCQESLSGAYSQCIELGWFTAILLLD